MKKTLISLAAYSAANPPQKRRNAAEQDLPRCAVRGLIRPGAMCGAVIVGGEFCGSSKECPHKLMPNTN